MILGRFSPLREALVRLNVRGPACPFSQVEVVIDTGFTEYLMLPSPLIASLSLPFRATVSMTLADGSRVQMDVYEVIVQWEGQERAVPCQESSGDPLAGVSLLYGSRLVVDIVDGGDVRIEPLSAIP